MVTTINSLNKNSDEYSSKLIKIDTNQNNLKTNETNMLNTLNKIDLKTVKNIKSIKVNSQSLNVNYKVVSEDISSIITKVDFYKKTF